MRRRLAIRSGGRSDGTGSINRRASARMAIRCAVMFRPRAGSRGAIGSLVGVRIESLVAVRIESPVAARSEIRAVAGTVTRAGRTVLHHLRLPGSTGNIVTTAIVVRRASGRTAIRSETTCRRRGESRGAIESRRDPAPRRRSSEASARRAVTPGRGTVARQVGTAIIVASSGTARTADMAEPETIAGSAGVAIIVGPPAQAAIVDSADRQVAVASVRRRAGASTSAAGPIRSARSARNPSTARNRRPRLDPGGRIASRAPARNRRPNHHRGRPIRSFRRRHLNVARRSERSRTGERPN
jgi:hypothetical protein